MTEYRTISKETADALWSTICRKLDEKVAQINSESEKDRLHLDIGNIIGIVKVRKDNSQREEVNAVGFELTMNTGGLKVWYQEGMIRWDQPVSAIKNQNTDALHYRYQGKELTIDELVDRVFEVWIGNKWKMLGKYDS